MHFDKSMLALKIDTEILQKNSKNELKVSSLRSAISAQLQKRKELRINSRQRHSISCLEFSEVALPEPCDEESYSLARARWVEALYEKCLLSTQAGPLCNDSRWLRYL